MALGGRQTTKKNTTTNWKHAGSTGERWDMRRYSRYTHLQVGALARTLFFLVLYRQYFTRNFFLLEVMCEGSSVLWGTNELRRFFCYKEQTTILLPTFLREPTCSHDPYPSRSHDPYVFTWAYMFSGSLFTLPWTGTQGVLREPTQSHFISHVY